MDLVELYRYFAGPGLYVGRFRLGQRSHGRSAGTVERQRDWLPRGYNGSNRLVYHPGGSELPPARSRFPRKRAVELRDRTVLHHADSIGAILQKLVATRSVLSGHNFVAQEAREPG